MKNRSLGASILQPCAFKGWESNFDDKLHRLVASLEYASSDGILYKTLKDSNAVCKSCWFFSFLTRSDLTAVIKITWSVEYMYLFPMSQRHYLHLILGINLLMDNAIRVREISYFSPNQEKHQLLRWTDVEIIAYPGTDDANSQPELWVLLH